jgi:hemolysin III
MPALIGWCGSSNCVAEANRFASVSEFQVSGRPLARVSRSSPAIERRADEAIHGLSILFAVAGSLRLASTFWRLNDAIIAGLAIYCFGLLTMFSCSAFYNLTENQSLKAVFRRLDHAMIFVMIAGTYTPLLLGLLPTPLGIGLLAVVWLGAGLGAAAKLLVPTRFERSSTVAYLLLGWIIVIALVQLIRVLALPGILLIGAGGLFYSVGVIFHLWSRLPFQNAVWHAFVLAGAVCHFVAILRFVALA